MAAEFDFIESLRRRSIVRPPVLHGIGDDAAVIAGSGRPHVVTTDMLMDGVDFIVGETPPALIGRKALAVNLSDIAAMAARPTAAFVSVALPKSLGGSFAGALYDGLFALADEFAVTIAGGDTNSWDGPLVINVAMIGEPVGTTAVLRSGAQPGDVILVTGAFGGSLRGRHLTFTPRIAEAARLLELSTVHALIDVSDGLAADLHHVLNESRVGAEVYADRIPIHPDARLMNDSFTPLRHALGDGEDFELIAAVPPADAERLSTAWDLPTPLTAIGTITNGGDAWLVDGDGARKRLPPWGWAHPLPT